MFKRCLCLVMAAAIAWLACACSAPAAPESPGSPPPSSSLPPPSSAAPEPESEPVEVPVSARLASRKAGADTLDWELEITDPGELQLLGEVLSTDGLEPLDKEQDTWLVHDGRVEFELSYRDGGKVTGLADPRRWSRIAIEDDRGTLWVGDTGYPHPADRCDRLLDLLLQKQVMEPEPPAPEPGEMPLSILLSQKTPGIDRLYTQWELEVTGEAEVKELMEILSPEGATPVRHKEVMNPDGGSPVSFELRYANTTLGGRTYAQECYRYDQEGSFIAIGNRCYRYPARYCDQLIAFLEGRGVTVTG